MARHGKFYNKMIQSREWRELRIQVLREQNGLCKWCMDRHGWVVPATECHHLREVETGRTEAEQRELMFNRTNVVALCHRCHADYHKQQRYHSTEVVKQRQQERQAAWLDEMANRFK